MSPTSYEYEAASPLSIPSTKACQHSRGMDDIAILLERTRIPKRFPKGCEKSTQKKSSRSWSLATPVKKSKLPPKRQNSLFDPEMDEVSPSLPGSYSYLLTPPNSIPDLSRSLSVNSLESSLSASSSSFLAKSARVLNPSLEEVDLATENPLLLEMSEDDEGDEDDDSILSSPSQSPSRRASTMGLLFRPLKRVGPALRASSMVSSLSAHLTSWANSLAASQFDDAYSLLASPGAAYSMAGNSIRRQHASPPSLAHLPRLVSASGPLKGHTTIIEAEMERPLLAESVQEEPAYVELQPWTHLSAKPAEAVPARGREPRMNPDFLRILVLETNMRKQGKIAAGSGRARMILSPRGTSPGLSHLRETLNEQTSTE